MTGVVLPGESPWLFLAGQEDQIRSVSKILLQSVKALGSKIDQYVFKNTIGPNFISPKKTVIAKMKSHVSFCVRYSMMG